MDYGSGHHSWKFTGSLPEPLTASLVEKLLAGGQRARKGMRAGSALQAAWQQERMVICTLGLGFCNICVSKEELEPNPNE